MTEAQQLKLKAAGTAPHEEVMRITRPDRPTEDVAVIIVSTEMRGEDLWAKWHFKDEPEKIYEAVWSEEKGVFDGSVPAEESAGK